MIDESLLGPFHGLTLAQIRAEIDRDGVRVTAERTLDAIDRINPQLNAFVHLDRDAVLADAERLDQLPPADRGPLHGVAVAIKELIDVAGWPVTSGSRVLEGRVAEQDAEAVARLRQAGALVVGLTLTHEFAYGPTGDVSRQGASGNPHDLTRMTGGSSAGSAAATAAGLVPFALGTDTGGSIRIPAAFCGIVGLKPAHGDVPVGGVQALAPGLDHVGVLAEDAELTWLAWSVLAGRSLPEPVTPQWSWLDIDRVPLVDPAVEQAVRGLYDEVSDHSTFDVSLGNWPEMRGVAGTIMSREAYDVHAHQLDERQDAYDPSTWERIDSGRYIGDEQLATARQTQRVWHDSLVAFLDDDQVLACPTVGITAPLIGEREMKVAGEDGVSTRIVTNLTVRWNLVGFPAVSVPAGDLGGLPYGIQLICKPGSEGALRAAVEQVRAAVRDSTPSRGAPPSSGAY